MSTTTHRDDPATTLTTRDPRQRWRRTAAIVLPIGPLGIVAVRALMPYWTDDSVEEMVAGVADHPARAEAIVWIFLVSFPALVLAPLVIGFVSRFGSPRLATVGAGLTFLGFAGLGAVGSTDVMTHAMAQDGFDQADIVRATDALVAHPVSVISVGVFVIGHIVGMVLLGIAVARAGVVTAWVGVAIAVSQPVHFVSAVVLPSRWLDTTLGWGLTTLGFTLVALAIWRMSDDEWDRPPVVSK